MICGLGYSMNHEELVQRCMDGVVACAGIATWAMVVLGLLTEMGGNQCVVLKVLKVLYGVAAPGCG